MEATHRHPPGSRRRPRRKNGPPAVAIRSLAALAVALSCVRRKEGFPGGFLFRPSNALSFPRPLRTSPARSRASLFLFSLRNGSDGEGDKDSGGDGDVVGNVVGNVENGRTTTTTATVERSGLRSGEDAEDFVAWMEGLKLGTPIGKLASPQENGSGSKPTTTATPRAYGTPSSTLAKTPDKDAGIEKAKAAVLPAGEGAGSDPEETGRTAGRTTAATRIPNGVGLRNPLSNLIQFEAMLELTRIAGSGEDDERGSGDAGKRTPPSQPAGRDRAGGNASDVFAVVDKLFKTFRTQEEAKQQQQQKLQQTLPQTTPKEQQKELLQLAQLEKQIPDTGSSNSNNSKIKETITKAPEAGKDPAMNLAEEVSSETTVQDLMDLEEYVGTLNFKKVSNIWDTFSSKDESPLETTGLAEAESVGEEEEEDPPAAAADASSSVLFRETYGPPTKPEPNSLVQAAEGILKDTTAKMEYLVEEASPTGNATVSASTTSGGTGLSLQDLVGRASSVLDVESISSEIVSAAQKIAKESGVSDFNVQFAADRAREATEFAVGVATAANAVLDAGYAYGSRSGAAGMTARDNDPNYVLAASAASQTAGSVLAAPSGEASDGSNGEGQAHQAPLFGAFASAQRIEPYEYGNVVYQGAEMGSLAGVIYEQHAEGCHGLGHSLVANGTTANVVWMVTDSVMDPDRLSEAFCHHEDDGDSPGASALPRAGPSLVRTITIRGFDASDENVDREELLKNICLATPEALDDKTADRVVFHKGLLDIAREIYADTKHFIDWVSPDYKIVLNGHSVGGSLSVLMLLLLTSDRGVGFVRDRIHRVYSHGSPPIAALVDSADSGEPSKFGGTQQCPILDAFDLPPSMVYGFIQPYDPVVRLFSDHDVLYPLVDDLGADGITLYASGPIRSLRPITRAIFQAWNGWPQFRDNWKGTCDTQYHSVGIQHLLLPDPLRYLNDRFISVNVGVPPVDAIVRIAPRDLLPALDQTFPLDTFQVSLVPQAVRSFLHHFYPAYDSSVIEYATKLKQEAEPVATKKSRAFKPFLTTKS